MLHTLGLAGPAELLLFMTAVLVLNATPGVDLLLTITRTAQGGARAGLAAALGIGSGCAVHALAAAFGLAALLALHPAAFTALRWAGAAYLLWLAISIWRSAWRAGAGADAEPVQRAVPLREDFRIGFVTNLLNPKVAFFFLAFLPQFIAPETADKTQAFLGLGLLFVVQSMLFLAAVVAAVAALRGAPAAARLRRPLQAVAGGLFAGLALRLAGAD